jgi:hypothetical protein
MMEKLRMRSMESTGRPAYPRAAAADPGGWTACGLLCLGRRPSGPFRPELLSLPFFR